MSMIANVSGETLDDIAYALVAAVLDTMSDEAKELPSARLAGQNLTTIEDVRAWHSDPALREILQEVARDALGGHLVDTQAGDNAEEVSA